MTSEIELRFPSSIYYADPYAAIRSVLGNDVEIINFKESNVILADNTILINVEYSAIDFDLFKLWKIEETKITSNSTQKIVATKLKDTITSKSLSDSTDKIVIVSNYSENSKYKLIYIKYLDRVNLFGNDKNIKIKSTFKMKLKQFKNYTIMELKPIISQIQTSIYPLFII